jgi:hypothetical protein
MNKKGMSLMLALFATLASLTIVGCVKDALGPVVNKTYELVNKVEGHVLTVDSTNLVSTVKSVSQPLAITKQAVAYIGSKVTNEDVKSVLETIDSSLGTILLAIDGVEVGSVEEVRNNILVEIANVKIQIEQVADAIGIVLINVRDLDFSSRSIADTQAELEALIN